MNAEPSPSKEPPDGMSLETQPYVPTAVPDDPVDFAATGYRIIRELGRGGMGIVYLAFDEKRQQMVALKTLQRLDPESLYQFKREFRALADVTHPNLVPLFELISDGQTWFFTMEYVEGVDFLSYMRGPDDSEPEPVRLRDGMRQLVEGVIALHNAGKLHRDIKPTNILVTATGHVVLVDFGLATDMEMGQPSQKVVGTETYMAPEQAAGHALTPASDWYSVGVTLYKSLTGLPPFIGDRMQVLLAKQQMDGPAPRSLAPETPDDLNSLCADLMRRNPAHRPTGAEVLDRLLGRRSAIRPAAEREIATAAVPASRAVFVGRGSYLNALNDAYGTMRQGRAVTVAVRGSSGLGKTALVQRFLATLRERGEAVVLAGRCYERESVPYKALDSLIDALAQYLVRRPDVEAAALMPRDIQALVQVFPVLHQAATVAGGPRRTVEIPDRQELRRRAFAALRELLARLGDRHPLVLAIDDLQWGDPDSAQLLAELLRPPNPPVLLLIGTFRSEVMHASPLLASLFHAQMAAGQAAESLELVIAALSAAEARELAQALLGPSEQHATQAEAIARESGGNPLFVSALVQHMRAGMNEPSAPRPSLDDVLWGQLQGLADEARRLLEVLSVAGQPLRQALAVRAAQLDVHEEVVLTHLRAAHLVRGTGPRTEDTIEPFHDRLREIVVTRLPKDALKFHHGRLAKALEDAGNADPESLAIHFHQSDDLTRAGHYYTLAAEQAAHSLAFDRAASLFRRALDLRPAAAGGPDDLLVKLADALANAGRGAEAAQLYETAATTAKDLNVLDLRRRAAYHYCISGRLDEGRAALGAVLQQVGMTLPRTPRHALISLLWGRAQLWLRGLSYRGYDAAPVDPADLNRIDVVWSATAGLSMFDVMAGADFQTRNLLLSLRAGEPYRLVRALAWQAAHISNLGRKGWPRARQLLKAARSLAQKLAHPHAHGVMALSNGVAEFTSGRWQSARVGLERAEEILRDQCTGVAWELDTAHTFALWSLFYLGELREMSRRSALLLREAQERGDLYAATTLGTFTEAIARLAENEPAEARRTVENFLQRWSQVGFHVQHMIALMSRTYVDLYCDDGASAWQRIEEQWPALAGSHLLTVQVIRALLTNLRARSALAAARKAIDASPLLGSAARDASRLEREKVPYAAALAQALRAGIAGLRGNRSEAGVRLASAAAGFEATDMRLFAAAARYRQGELQGGAGGAALMSAATAALTAQGIQNPISMIRTLTPQL